MAVCTLCPWSCTGCLVELEAPVHRCFLEKTRAVTHLLQNKSHKGSNHLFLYVFVHVPTLSQRKNLLYHGCQACLWGVCCCCEWRFDSPFILHVMYLTWSAAEIWEVALEKDKRPLGTHQRRWSVENARSVRRRRRPCEKVFLRSIGISRATRGRLLMPPQSSSWQWCWCTKTFPFPQQNIFCTFLCECTDMI